MAVEPIFESYGNKIIGVPNNEESGGSGGHVIENSSGTDLPQEDTLQFADSHVTDDSTNGKTIVETFKAVTEAEYSSETEDGAYIITDGDGATIEPASEDYVEVTADGEKTWSQLLDELWTKVDTTKASFISVLIIDHSVFHMLYMGGSYVLSNCNITSQVPTVARINIRASGSKYEYWNGTTYINYTPNTATSGIEFHYGNKKAIVDLQTTAGRCVTSDGGNVQLSLNERLISVEIPFSSFAWDSNNVAFKTSQPINVSPITNVKGFLVRPTNGNAILGAYLNSQGYLYVSGVVSTTMTGDISAYTFKCFAIGTK